MQAKQQQLLLLLLLMIILLYFLLYINKVITVKLWSTMLQISNKICREKNSLQKIKKKKEKAGLNFVYQGGGGEILLKEIND